MNDSLLKKKDGTELAFVRIPETLVFYQIDLEKKAVDVVKSVSCSFDKKTQTKTIAYWKRPELYYLSAQNKMHAQKRLLNMITDIINQRAKDEQNQSNKETIETDGHQADTEQS